MSTTAKSGSVDYYHWECPTCGDVCTDPADFRTTECHNGHVVRLGHERKGWLDVYPQDSPIPGVDSTRRT